MAPTGDNTDVSYLDQEQQQPTDTMLKRNFRHSSPAVRFATPKTVERGRRQGQEAQSDPARDAVTAINTNLPNFHATNKDTPLAEDTSQILKRMNQSHFTPIMTPNQSGDVVLLSPARTITESLQSLASETAQHFETIWDEVGYSPDDRAAVLNDLILKVQMVCEEKLSEEQAVAKQYRLEIAQAREEIQKLSDALQQPTPWGEDKENTDYGTLSDEYQYLQSTLDDLRQHAEEVQDALMSSRDFLEEAHNALGIEMDPRWRDVRSDLTKKRLDLFREKHAELKGELSSRSAAMVQLVKDCLALMKDLGLDNSDRCTDLDRQISGSIVRAKDDSFIMASKHRTESCVGISGEAMKQVEKRLAELHGEKRVHKERIADIGVEVLDLWEQLHIPENERQAFATSVANTKQSFQPLPILVQRGEDELHRLKTMKAGMMGQLVQEVREKIQQLWNELGIDQESRDSFGAMHVLDQSLDDEVLKTHQIYLAELREQYEKRKPIVRLIERREGILKERMEYEALQEDPDRLKQRSAALARQLMEEEKMAKRIKKELPKLTEVLNDKLCDWKTEHGEDFVYSSGRVYLEEMAQQDQEWIEYKEIKHQKMLHKHKKHEENVTNGAAYGVSKKHRPHHTLQHRHRNDNHHHNRKPLGETATAKHTTASRTAY